MKEFTPANLNINFVHLVFHLSWRSLYRLHSCVLFIKDVPFLSFKRVQANLSLDRPLWTWSESVCPEVFHDVFFQTKFKATRFNYHFSYTILLWHKKRNGNNEDFCDLYYFWILPWQNEMESVFKSRKYRKVIKFIQWNLKLNHPFNRLMKSSFTNYKLWRD